jgi:hypothetical protein
MRGVVRIRLVFPQNGEGPNFDGSSSRGAVVLPIPSTCLNHQPIYPPNCNQLSASLVPSCGVSRLLTLHLPLRLSTSNSQLLPDIRNLAAVA